MSMKQSGEKISCLTAYDASFSYLLDQAGIDVLLVGDSLGMVIQGHDTTLPVSVDDMVYHTRHVVNARSRSFVIADMPFASYATREQALQTARLLTQTGGAQMVKLEGVKIDIINFLADQGFLVCGHLGLLPQSFNRLGGFRVQGRDHEQAQAMIANALKIEQAGANLLVLECVPAAVAAEISQRLTIPVIGIGAGLACDGQVLVVYDILGITLGTQPRFIKNFIAETGNIVDAVQSYHQAVKNQQFPSIENSY